MRNRTGAIPDDPIACCACNKVLVFFCVLTSIMPVNGTLGSSGVSVGSSPPAPGSTVCSGLGCGSGTLWVVAWAVGVGRGAPCVGVGSGGLVGALVGC